MWKVALVCKGLFWPEAVNVEIIMLIMLISLFLQFYLYTLLSLEGLVGFLLIMPESALRCLWLWFNTSQIKVD